MGKNETITREEWGMIQQHRKSEEDKASTINVERVEEDVAKTTTTETELVECPNCQEKVLTEDVDTECPSCGAGVKWSLD